MLDPGAFIQFFSCSSLASKGEQFSPLATNPCQFDGKDACIFSACSLLLNPANTQAPVPVSLAPAYCSNQSKTAATSGYRRRTTGSQSLCPPDFRKSRIVIAGVFRVKSGELKIPAVGTMQPGAITRYQHSSSSISVSKSPTEIELEECWYLVINPGCIVP